MPVAGQENGGAKVVVVGGSVVVDETVVVSTVLQIKFNWNSVEIDVN